MNIGRGYTFGATESVTNAKLHTLVDSATGSAILTADISASQITDAKINDVSGAKLTTLTAVPSGAGVIPAANLTSVAQKGANSDITSLSGLTTALSTAQGGTGATANANAANGVVKLNASAQLPAVDGSLLTGYVPGAASVITTMLKTATSEVSVTTGAFYTYAGGAYAFFPQKKTSVAGIFHCTMSTYGQGVNYPSTSYSGYIWGEAGGGVTGYLLFTYVTASGEDYWLWLLVNKNTKEVITMNGAPDHIAYGNSNDFEKQPHPFMQFDLLDKEIILIEKQQAKAIQQEAKVKRKSVLTLVNEEYKVDFTQTHLYVPIHSGQFSPEETPVLVETIPDYIQVRKLIRS